MAQFARTCCLQNVRYFAELTEVLTSSCNPTEGKMEMRNGAEMMESDEVTAVLEAMREPLEKRFSSIAKRKTKILDPKKRPKGAQEEAVEREVQQLQVGVIHYPEVVVAVLVVQVWLCR